MPAQGSGDHALSPRCIEHVARRYFALTALRSVEGSCGLDLDCDFDHVGVANYGRAGGFRRGEQQAIKLRVPHLVTGLTSGKALAAGRAAAPPDRVAGRTNETRHVDGVEHADLTQ